MKLFFAGAAIGVGALSMLACHNQPVRRVEIPSATEPSAYQPQAYPKPLPPPGYDPSMQPPPPPAPPAAPSAPGR